MMAGKMTDSIDTLVVGAGVVGLAVARRAAMAGCDVVVLEAANAIGTGISSRNSEVIHAGIHYPEGSLRARLCVAGRDALYAYCETHGVDYKRTGKLIVATAGDEVAALDAIGKKAEANGVHDLTRLDAAGVRDLEPNVQCHGALLSPSTGIVDSHGYMLALQGDAEAAGAQIAFNSPFAGGRLGTGFIDVQVGGDQPMKLRCRRLVNAAGLQAQTVAAAIEGFPEASIPPLYYAKGNYFTLAGKSPFERLIYPVPGPVGLGVHSTVDLGGQCKFGPDVEWIDAPDYDVDPARAERFYKAIRRYWPDLADGALQPGYVGVRPKLAPQGQPAADFTILGPETHGVPGLVNLFGIDSPGLTSSLAIADHVAGLLGFGEASNDGRAGASARARAAPWPPAAVSPITEGRPGRFPMTAENRTDADAGGAGGAPLTHAEYHAIADEVLPGAALGAHVLPEDVRFVIRRGRGSRIEDVDGNVYIDYVLGAGALILGHAHPAPTAAVREQAGLGIHFFGTPNEACLRLARELTDAIPSAERLLFTTTGSEATFYALRLARAFTGRSNILKFEGAYHGNHDYSQISITPKAASNYPAGRPDSAGLPEVLPPTVLIAPYNDLEATRRIVEENRADLACVIVEPAQRVIFSEPGFLQGLRRICDDNGVVLVFDEVVTGFRLAYGGGQEYFGVTADLAAYGKVVGGGAPLGAVAGRAEIIDFADPARKGGPDYAQVNGTLHGNPLASVAGLATLLELKKPGFYEALNSKADDLRRATQDVLDRHRLDALACGEASLWQVLFLDKPPRDYADVLAADSARGKALDLACLKEGLYVLPGVRKFVSAAHTDADAEETARALDKACRALN